MDYSGNTALEYGAKSRYPSVVAALLSLGGKVTTRITKAAAENEIDGKAVMELLLDRRCYQITITDEVVRIAAGNWDGKAVMGLLLDCRGDQITITDEVVKTTAINEVNGKAVMELLFHRHEDHTIITDAVVSSTIASFDQDLLG